MQPGIPRPVHADSDGEVKTKGLEGRRWITKEINILQ